MHVDGFVTKTTVPAETLRQHISSAFLREALVTCNPALLSKYSPDSPVKVNKERISGMATWGMGIIGDFHLLLVGHLVLAGIAFGFQYVPENEPRACIC